MEQNGQQQPEEGVYYVGESIPQDRQQVLEEDKPGPAVSIEALETEVFLKVETQFYVLLVDYGDRKYEIRRRYSDFEWLFRALSTGYPGHILPYFPKKSIESYFINKLNIDCGLSKDEELKVRRKELASFIQSVCTSPGVCNSHYVRIFLDKSADEFQRMKKNIEEQIEELNAVESTSNSLFSVIERGIAWVSELKSGVVSFGDGSVEWQETSTSISRWAYCVRQLLEKFYRLLLLKQQEISWQGPSTEIDSVYRLKAKVISGRQYNELFVDDVRLKIVYNLLAESKRIKQIEYQLEYRENMLKVLRYLQKMRGSEDRMGKLIRRKDKFETVLIQEWKAEQERSKLFIRYLNVEFAAIWKDYIGKIYKIWK